MRPQTSCFRVVLLFGLSFFCWLLGPHPQFGSGRTSHSSLCGSHKLFFACPGQSLSFGKSEKNIKCLQFNCPLKHINIVVLKMHTLPFHPHLCMQICNFPSLGLQVLFGHIRHNNEVVILLFFVNDYVQDSRIAWVSAKKCTIWCVLC